MSPALTPDTKDATPPAPSAPSAPSALPAEHHSSLVSWAYHEYCRQQEAGVAPTPEQYCARFPAIAEGLAQLIDIHGLVDDDPHFIDPPKVRWPEPGEEFVGFRLERPLGRGRQSQVFLATEPALGHRRVVVKVAQDGMDEALTLGRLVHPNIVPIFSVRKDPATGLAVVCMPYLGEATLRDLCARVLAQQPLPRSARVILDAAAKGPAAEAPDAPDEPGAASTALLRSTSYLDGVRHLALQLLDALAFIHAEGVCHRDLKPSNVLLTRAGVPMLLDFNLSGDVRHVRLGLGGTPTYMAPEQLQQLQRRDGTGLDGRADLFSLGVMLYELLTGRQPFPSPPAGLDVNQIRDFMLPRHEAGAVPVRVHNPAVDRRMAELVDRCLALAPADRPASARHARALLETPLRRGHVAFIGRRGLVLAVFLPLLLSGSTAWHMLAASALPDRTIARNVDQYALGQEAYRLGDYPEARRHLDDYLRSHPDDARAWFQHGAVALKLKQYGIAVMDFSAANRLKSDGLTRACLGYAYHESGQPKMARIFFQQAVQAGYDRAEVFNDLGLVDLHEGALADAERDLTQAIERNRGLQAPYHNRGRVYLRRVLEQTARATRGGAPVANGTDASLLQQALSDFKTALAIGPPSGELYHDLAAVCAHLSAKDHALTTEAIEHLANGLRHGLDPAALKLRPFCKALTNCPTYQSLCAQQATAHPHSLAQRFLPMLPE